MQHKVAETTHKTYREIMTQIDLGQDIVGGDIQ